MPDLTDSQMDMLVQAVERHEKTGISHHIGPRRVMVENADHGKSGVTVENEQHADARALVRAGLVEWHPKPRPFAKAAIRRIGKPFSPIRQAVDSAERIVPTPKGRVTAQEHVKRSEAAKKAARTRKRREEADS